MKSKREKIANKLEDIKLSKPRSDLKSLFSKRKDGTVLLDNAFYVDITLIIPNPNQPRQYFKQSSLKELAESIKNRGVLQPIRVRPKGDLYEIITGERRWHASKMANLSELPCVVVNQEDKDVYIDALIENIQREDLNPIDRANGLSELKVNLGLPSWNAVGEKIGISKQHVFNLLGLKSLPENVQLDIKNGLLTEKHGRALKKLSDNESKFNEAYIKIKEEKLSGDESLILVGDIKKGKKTDFNKDFQLLTNSLNKTKDKLLLADIQSLNSKQKGSLKDLLVEMEKVILCSKEKL